MKNTFYSQGNPYTIVRTTDTTYTASVGELIIADETEITLPSGVPNGSVIAVRSADSNVTTDVIAATGSVDGFSGGTAHQEAKTGEYVYDGSDWYLRNSIDVRDGAIPDSVVAQFDASTFSAGDANWSDDVGSNDMSLSGDPQSGTLSNGDPSVVGDGTDDNGLVPFPAELDGNDLNSWAIETSFQSSSSNTSQPRLWGVVDSTGQRVILSFNTNDGFNVEEGQIFLEARDGSGNSILVEPSTNPNLNDGSRHVVTVNAVDLSAGDVEIIIDGSSVSLSFRNQQNLTDFQNWGRDLGVWSLNNDGSISAYLNAGIGVMRLHGTSISGQTI